MSQAEVQSVQTSVLPAGVWDIDPDHSNVEFVARHLLSRVRGRFAAFEGALTVGDDPADSSVEITIDADSIETRQPERDAHLRSPDFLDADRFPHLRFRSTAVRVLDAGRAEIDGELTIRDVTRPVTLDVEYLGWSDDPYGGKRAGFSARTAIERDEFGASWNVVVETGGLLVGKLVQIELEIEAVLRPS